MSDDAVKGKGRGRSQRTPESPETTPTIVPGYDAAGGLVEIEQLDQRTLPVKRYRAAVDGLQQQLGGMTVAEAMLVRRCAALMLFCEQQDAKLAAGEDIDIGPYTKACMTLATLLKAIGLAHTSRTPKRGDIVDAHSQAILDT